MSISDGACFFDAVYNMSKLEFSDSGITAYWMGNALYSFSYLDVVRIEDKGTFPHWIKVVSKKDYFYFQGAYMKILDEFNKRGILIQKVKKYIDVRLSM